jgi:uncharacterized membrane protein
MASHYAHLRSNGGSVDELGKNFWWKTVGIVIGIGVLGLLAMIVFTGVYYRFGALGALLIVFGILMVVAYRHDKKAQREYED